MFLYTLYYDLYIHCHFSKHFVSHDTVVQPQSLCKDSISQTSSNKEPTYSVKMFIDN